MAEKHLAIVRLYYTGGFVKENPVVTAMGNSFKVPPVGEYIEVPQYIAKRLILRNRHPNGTSVFTQDKRFAEAVIEQRKRGEITETVAPKEYTREELLEMLAAVDSETAEVNTKTRRTKAEDKEIA